MTLTYQFLSSDNFSNISNEQLGFSTILYLIFKSSSLDSFSKIEIGQFLFLTTSFLTLLVSLDNFSKIEIGHPFFLAIKCLFFLNLGSKRIASSILYGIFSLNNAFLNALEKFTTFKLSIIILS